jgi:hypothetical protein
MFVPLAYGQDYGQDMVEPIPASFLRPYSVRETNSAAPASRPAFTADSGLQLRDMSWLGGAVQYEAPRESINGTYTRPKIAVGIPSDSLKGWLHAAGISAEQCLLPMVRARARVSPDGDPSGTLWLHARCTFQ